jgi:hypothetical protein
MKRFWKIVGLAMLVAVIGVVAVAGVSLAQGPTPTPDGRHGWGRGFGMGGSWGAFDAAAEALGLSPEQLFTQLHGGKTLADVAEEQGVDLETVYAAMNAAKQEAMRQAIEQAVTNGRMSREQADWMLQGLEQGWLGGHGFRGHGFRPGGLKPGDQDQPQGSGFRGRFFAPGRSL